MLEEYLDVARRSPLLGRLPEGVRDCLLSKVRLRHFERGRTIVLQGERALDLKIVVRGRLKLYRVASSGCEAIVDLLDEGCSFDEVAALRGEWHRVSAEAVSNASLLSIDLRSIGSCPMAQRELQMAVMAAAADSLDALLAHVETLKVQSGAQRLAEFLAGLCGPDHDECAIDLPYEKHLIAGRLGMKPESLSRAFGRLRRWGVQVQQNHVRITSVATLRAYSAEDPALSWAAE